MTSDERSDSVVNSVSVIGKSRISVLGNQLRMQIFKKVQNQRKVEVGQLADDLGADEEDVREEIDELVEEGVMQWRDGEDVVGVSTGAAGVRESASESEK